MVKAPKCLLGHSCKREVKGFAFLTSEKFDSRSNRTAQGCRKNVFVDAHRLPPRPVSHPHFLGQKRLKHFWIQLCSGALSLSIGVFYLQFLPVCSQFTILASLLAVGALLANGGEKVHLSTWTDCKERSLIVSNKASIVSKQGSPSEISCQCHDWNNRNGYCGGGTAWEPLPNTTHARIHTYPRCIQTGLDTHSNALFLQSSTEEPWAHAPTHCCAEEV